MLFIAVHWKDSKYKCLLIYVDDKMFIDLVQLHAGGVEAVEVVEEGGCFAMLALASSSLL